MTCILCNRRFKAIPAEGKSGRTHSSVYRCPRCGAVQGNCYLGDSYDFVLPYFDQGPEEDLDHASYYDLECLGSAGIIRRHGWFNRLTHKIVQVG